MSSQQRATLTNAALINFFGTLGTVSTIMQTVQQTQQQTEQYTLGTNFIPTEQCQQLLPVVATDSEEDSGMSNLLDITHQDNSLDTTQQDNTQSEPQISHIQTPHLLHLHQQPSQTQHQLLLSQIIPDKVIGFHHIRILFLTSIVGEEDKHIHKLKTKKENTKRMMTTKILTLITVFFFSAQAQQHLYNSS